MKRFAVLMLIMAAIVVSVSGQKQDEAKQSDKFVQQLGQFESDWLTAILNDDKTWHERFFTGKLIVVPFDNEAIKNRAQETVKMVDPQLKPDEMKVRITGNITLLTNAGNRSFYFLDTFNKRGGKWQIIATHFSQTSQSPAENIEQAIMQIEREWNLMTVKKDIAGLKRIIADDFSGVNGSGNIINKTQIINDIESGSDNVRSETAENLKIRVFGETAVVTGQHSVKGERNKADNNSRLFFTKIWAKRDGQWQMVNYQVTETK